AINIKLIAINGLLQVTGGNSNLYLINPSGILFGPDAQLNLPANFTAATATGIGFEGGWFDLSTTAYSELTGVPELLGFDGAALGNLVNSGDLAVAEGQTLSLLGGTVVNTGEIEAPGGNIIVSAIASPEDGSAIVRLSPVDGILSLDMQAEALAATTPEALSLPQLITGGGFVESATGLTVNEAGVAVLSGSGVQIDDEAGTAILSGQLSVAGEVGGEVGGEVQVTGDRVGLLAANIDASGLNGGGTALIGGDYKGQGVLPTAQQTYVSGDSAIDVSSTATGNAGRAIVWADNTTRFYGTVDAQGGQLAGDGGLVEISGAQNLTFNGIVLLEAPNGRAGSLLLDPENIFIVDATGPTDAGGNLVDDEGNLITDFEGNPININNLNNAELDDEGTGPGIFENEGVGESFFISEQALEALSGSVTLQATNVINTATSLADEVLSFQAGPGDTVTLEAQGQTNNSLSDIGIPQLETAGGNIVLIGSNIGEGSPSHVSNGGDIEITSTGVISGIDLIDSSSDTGSGGNVILNAQDRISFIDLVDTSSSSTVPGSADGGDITVVTEWDGTTDISGTVIGIGISLADTSSSNGDAGDIRYTADQRIGGLTFDGISFIASAPNGQAGNITVETLGLPEAGIETLITSIDSIEAVSGTGQGGNVLLIADEINLDSNGIDPAFGGTDFGSAEAIQLSGQLIFQPQSPGLNILIGGTGFTAGISPFDPNDPENPNTADKIFPDPDLSPVDNPNLVVDDGDSNTLHISAYELNIVGGQPEGGPRNRVDGGVVVRTDGTGIIEFSSTLQTQELFSDITIEGDDESVIIGPDQNTDYIVLGTGSGIIGGFGSDLDADGIQDTYLRFTDVGTIQAGEADDSLIFLNDTSTFDGNFDGGGGNNVLDFSGDATVSSAVFPEGAPNASVDGYTQALNVDLTADPAVTLVADPGFVIVEGEVTNITGVIGGSGDDTLLGDEGNNLLGGGGGNDVIDGRGGDDIVEIERDASFELLAGSGAIDNELRIDNGNDGTFEETEQISNVEIARLLGGAGDNTFTIGADSWQGPLILLDGSDGSDTYAIGVDGVGTGSIVVGDTGMVGTDTLTVVGSDGDDVFALDVAGSPNPGGFDPTPIAGCFCGQTDSTYLVGRFR
ncbi:MAG: filamentous hemagglutinin N-terminal domain-containing protein, partial [Cyanobacteria bacterium J06636_16]